MPRTARKARAGYAQHVINRAVMRLPIFNTEYSYRIFETLLLQYAEEVGIHLFAYCIMPNHWHLLVKPQHDGDLGVFMHHLTNAHTRYVHTATETIGTGPLYQGRYKSFMVEEGTHFLTVLRYVERNAARAGLVTRGEDWRWGSAWRRVHDTGGDRPPLATPETPLPHPYREWLNEQEEVEMLKNVRTSVTKGTPFGRDTWVEATVAQFGLEHTHRDAGRPRK